RAPAARSDHRQAAGTLPSAAHLARATKGARLRLTGWSRPVSLGKSCDHVGLHHWPSGTGAWSSRALVPGRPHVAGTAPSPPTAPLPWLAHPRGKPAFLTFAC